MSSAGTTYLVPGARRTEALLIGFHVLLPEFPLLDVSEGEFPVLFRLVDALQKTLSLLLLREMEVEFDNARSVAVEMFLEMHDGTIPVLPDRLLVE